MLNLLLATSPAQAQETPPVTLRLAPAASEVSLGQTTDVAVEVVDVQDLYGMDLALSFNPNVVEIVDADPSQAGVQIALGTFLDSGFAVLNAADNVSGTLRFAMTQLNPSEPKSGTGTLIVIRLRGKQVSGGTPLTLTSAQLARRDGTGLSTNLISGQVSVVAASSAPTGTPIPTQGAGTLMPASTPQSLPVTAVPTIGRATVPPTLSPPVIGLSATITPRPANPLVTTTSSAPTQDSAASSVTEPLPGSAGAVETPQPTSASSALPTTESISTPAAIAAVASPSGTSAGVQAAIRVTEQSAAAVSSSTGSATALLALSGALGIIGIVAVLLVMRRRSH